MPDNKAHRGARDRSRISLSAEDEVTYWTQRLGVTRDEIERAIRNVGNGAEAVAHYLKQ